MTGNFEQRKRAISTAFSSVVRYSALAEAIQIQSLIAPLDQLLSHCGPEGPLDLGPLRELLLGAGVQEEPIAEAFLALQHRQEMLGIALRIPPEVERLSDTKKRKLLHAWQRRAQPTTSPGMRVPVESSGEADPAASAPVEGPVPVAPQTGPRKGLWVVLALVLVAGGGVTAYSQMTAPPTAETVVVQDPKGLICSQLRVNQGTAVCSMSKEAYDMDTTAARKARAAATKKALADRAVTKILIQVDGKLVGRL